MFKKILVPLDGSALSVQALPAVQRLVQGTDAEVTLFFSGQSPTSTLQQRKAPGSPVPLIAMPGAPGAYATGLIPAPQPAYAESPGQAVDRWEHDAHEYLAAAGQPLVQAGTRVQSIVHLGNPAKEIVRCAKDGGFELIVMAMHGRSSIGQRLHSSVTAAVIRSGVAPVLIVRPTRRPRQTPAQRPAEAGSP